MLAIFRRLLGAVAQYPLYTIVAALLAIIALQTIRLERSHARELALGLEKMALEAKADQSHAVGAKEKAALVKLFGQYATGVQRLILQVKDSNTKLGKALGQETKLSADLVVMVKDLNAQLTGTPVVVVAGDVRVDSFTVDSIRPYHVKAVAMLPPSPQAGTLNLWIGQDTTYLHIHAGCLPKNRDGLRPASLTVVSDSFRFAQIGRVTQDQDVCNPQKASMGARLKHTAVVAATGAAAWEGLKGLLRLLKVFP